MALALASVTTTVWSQIELTNLRPGPDIFLAQSRLHEGPEGRVEGTPFLASDWSQGSVKFKSGKIANDATLIFSLFNNRLYFKKGEQVFEFVDPVTEFSLNYKEGNKSFSPIYRNGYSPTGKNTIETYYEVLADGKLQLLEYRYKVIGKYRPTYSDPEVKRFEVKSLLYARLPSGEMVLLTDIDNDLIKSMPDKEDQIKDLIKQHKLKPRDRQDAIKLFQLLNQGL